MTDNNSFLIPIDGNTVSVGTSAPPITFLSKGTAIIAPNLEVYAPYPSPPSGPARFGIRSGRGPGG